jgi:glycosyltransferase involved in cell wall biosynthesis
MKLLIATGLYPPESGGPATYTKLLEEHLPKEGVDVRVLAFSEVRKLPKLIRHGVFFLKCFAAAGAADVVYAQDTVSVGLPSFLAARLRGKKFLLRVPGDYAWEQARQRFSVTDELDTFQARTYGWRVAVLRIAQTWVVNGALAIVVPSEYMKKIVEGWGGKRVQVIYSAVELVVPESVEKPKNFFVVSAGRRVPWKGFEAIERVVARELSWSFFLAENLPRARALGYIQAADVFVLNSTYEGLSHVLVETMTLGTPIIATNVGGNPELIRDEVDGLLIPPKDDEALYTALTRVAQDAPGARARADSAKERAKKFSIEHSIFAVHKLLQTL